jgi:hypothetical protein
MTLLLPTNEANDAAALKEVRDRARDLYRQTRGRNQPSHARVVRVPTRAELDELWALVPSEMRVWARGIVDREVRHARAEGWTATLQTLDDETVARMTAAT